MVLSEALVILVCTPADYTWAQALAQRLTADGYHIYLEPLHDEDPTVQRQTADALYQAQMMLAVISRESALGDSAPTFEAWWRPFLQNGKRVVACIMPDAPPGAENWMPYDLVRQTHVNFKDSNAYATLRSLLPELHPLLPPSPEPDLIEAEDKDETPPPPKHEPIITVQPPTVRIVLNVLVGLVLLLVMWIAALNATDDNTSIALWLAIVFVIEMGVFLLGRFASKRRERLQDIINRRHAAAARDTTFPIYLEVIESKIEEEVGQIWGMLDEELTIGKNYEADIPLHDRHLDRDHCTVFVDKNRFYLENKTRRRTVLYGRRLGVGEISELQNGDLIAVGQSTVLQLRINLQ